MNPAQWQGAPTGWYPDPTHRAALRHWSGQAWTSWVGDGHAVWHDPDPIRRPLVPADLGALVFVEEVFLPEARARGVLAEQAASGLAALLSDLAREARSGAPAVVPQPGPLPSTVPAPIHPASATPFGQSPPNGQGAVPASWETRPASSWTGPVVVREPSAFAQWWSRSTAAAGSDLGVHGLAYLGVLLLFVGVFGLVAFAFADVTPSLRPVAEVASAAVPFLAARMLLRHGAIVVGRALEVVAGFLLPVMLVTSVLDDFPFPPDLHGTSLVVALTVICVLTGAGYALWSRRYPASGLRLVAAPMGWFAVAMATLGVGRAIPSGEDVAVPSSPQLAAVAAALVLTLLAARRWPGARLAGPTRTAAVPATIVLAVLALLTWASEGSPPIPVAATGILLLVAIALLRPLIADPVADVAGPLWWGLVALGLLADLTTASAAALAAAGFLGLLEVAGRRARPGPALALPGLGLLICLVGVHAEPWWAAATLTVVAAWAVARRTDPWTVDGVRWPLDLAAAALPVAAVIAFGLATDLSAGLVAATGLVAAATVPATRRVLGRGADDPFWRLWWYGAVPVTALVAVLAWDVVTWPAVAVAPTEQWMVAGSVLVLAAISAVGPISAVLRPWVVTALAVLGWLMVCDVAEVPDLTRGVVAGIGALLLVATAHRTRGAMPIPSVPGPAASLGLTGHALAAVSLGLTGPGWGLVAVVVLATVGLALTAALDDRDHSPVGVVLAGVGAAPRHLPWALTAIGLPVSLRLTLDAAGTLPLDAPWAPAVAFGTAVLYAAAARLALPPRLTSVLVQASFVAALIGALTPRAAWPAVGGLGCLIVAVLLLPATRRAAPMVWAAWAAVTPLVGLVAWQTVPWFGALSRLTATAAALVVVGGLLLVGAAAADLRGRPWVPTVAPQHRWLTPPAILGALQVGTGLLLSTGPVAPTIAGALTVTAGTIALVVGVLARAGILGAGAALLGWAGAWQLAGPGLEGRPWIAVVVVAGLLVAAEALYRLSPDAGPWSRWDIPLLVSAAPVALTGLVAAADGEAMTPVFVLIGLEVVAVAVRLQRRRALAEVLGWTGTVLVLAGAGEAGSGWLALGLLVLAVVHTGLAVRASAELRTLRQLTGVLAALAAWAVALDWFAWSAQHSVDVTAAIAGTVVLVLAGVSWLRHGDGTSLLDRSWLHLWGGAGLLVSAVATLASLRPEPLSALAVAPSVWVLLGLLEVAGGLVAAAGSLRLPWLRDLAAGVLLTTLGLSFQVWHTEVATQVAVLAGLSAVLAAATLTLAFLSPGNAWARPCAEIGGGAAVIAVLTGMAQLPDGALLVPALAATTVQVAALGVAWRSVALQVLAPALACGSWVLFVQAAVDGGPYWYTIAVGLALLVIAGVWRRDRRERALDVAGPEVVALELAGIAFLVGAAFTQAVTHSVLHALVATGLGIAVALWGLVTRVRRRVVAGAAVALAALVVLVAVPLVALLPAWGGAGMWLLIAGVGLLAVLVATLLERGRTAVRSTIGRVGGLTAGWE